MNTKDKNHYRDLLEKLNSRVSADANALKEETLSGGVVEGTGELSNAPLHLADRGTEEYLTDMTTVFAENEELMAIEIRNALARIESEKFGTCEGCGQEISKARLNAIPYTRFCITCAEKSNTIPQVNLNAGRPQNPNDTLSPEGQMNEDWQSRTSGLDNTMYNEKVQDRYAAGEAGGGTEVGGLAGTNIGRGDPDVAALQEASAGPLNEHKKNSKNVPTSGNAGGAVGGTPARKRAK